MRKMKSIFFMALFSLCMTVAFGQDNVKKVSKFEAGTVLTAEDIGFLSLVTKTKLSDASKKSVTIKNTEYTEGQTLTKADAAKIKSTVTAFQKTNKGASKPNNKAAAKGAQGKCCYWYYWCDYYGRCRYYYYCYWC